MIISLTCNFSNIKFPSSVSITLKILQKRQKTKDWFRKKIERDGKFIR